MPRLFVLTTIALAIALLLAYKSSDMDNSGDSQHWADGPCELVHTPQYSTKKEDIWTKGATHMALLHNAILRGFNSIYLQAPHVKVEDYAAFVGYSLTWHRFVKSHHNDEEAELFPEVDDILKEEGIWKETHQEHGIHDICSANLIIILTNGRIVSWGSCKLPYLPDQSSLNFFI